MCGEGEGFKFVGIFHPGGGGVGYLESVLVGIGFDIGDGFEFVGIFHPKGGGVGYLTLVHVGIGFGMGDGFEIVGDFHPVGDDSENVGIDFDGVNVSDNFHGS